MGPRTRSGTSDERAPGRLATRADPSLRSRPAMSFPIDPPGGPKRPPGGPTAAGEAPGTDAPLGAERGRSFADAVAEASPAESPAPAEALGADAAAVIDRLVAEQLASPQARGLDAAGRRALEAHLRATLEDDPGLRALVEDAAGER